MSMQPSYMLTNEQTWPIWIDSIWSTAKMQEIWPYMDPNTQKVAELPTRLHEPDLNHYQPGAISYKDLPDDKHPHYEHSFQMWLHQSSHVGSIQEKYFQMDQYIHSTITKQHQPIIAGKETIHEKLKALSECFAKHPYQNIWQLYQVWYNHLIKTPNSQNLFRWIHEWESFLVEVQGTGQLCLEKKKDEWDSIFCFIDALQPVDPGFAAQSECELQRDNSITIQTILNEYQGHLQGISGSNPLSKAAYTTLGNLSTGKLNEP